MSGQDFNGENNEYILHFPNKRGNEFRWHLGVDGLTN